MPYLIALAGLVTLALWRRSQGPITLDPGDSLFGKTTPPEPPPGSAKP